MMSQVAERIYQKIQHLISEKEQIQNQINKINQTIANDKKVMHHTELEIIAEGAATPVDGVSGMALTGRIRELGKEKDGLHRDERTLLELSEKQKDLIKTIDEHRFWMNRADSLDPARQREAEKKIFG